MIEQQDLEIYDLMLQVRALCKTSCSRRWSRAWCTSSCCSTWWNSISIDLGSRAPGQTRLGGTSCLRVGRTVEDAGRSIIMLKNYAMLWILDFCPHVPYGLRNFGVSSFKELNRYWCRPGIQRSSVSCS
jgi:hypothetical protein